MANKVADTHVTVSGVVFHNPSIQPSAPSVGKAVAASTKSVGQPNAVVHGQVNLTSTQPSIVFDNPA